MVEAVLPGNCVQDFVIMSLDETFTDLMFYIRTSFGMQQVPNLELIWVGGDTGAIAMERENRVLSGAALPMTLRLIKMRGGVDMIRAVETSGPLFNQFELPVHLK